MSEWAKAMQTPTGSVVTTIVAMFRAVVSLRIISADLIFNPSLSKDVVRRAVNVNEPRRFLPQPWPPVDTTISSGLKIATLQKMKSLISFKYGLQSASSADVQAKLAKDYPMVNPDDQASGNTLFAATTSLIETGDVLFGFHHPSGGQFPLDSLAESGTATIDYVTQMVSFALAQELENLEHE